MRGIDDVKEINSTLNFTDASAPEPVQTRPGAHQASYTGLSKKMDGIWNRYNLKSTGRIYTFGILKCSEKFKVLDLP